MTLRCECGGMLEITGQNYGKTDALEEYECVDCGRTGTYSFGDGPERMTGCVTSSPDTGVLR